MKWYLKVMNQYADFEGRASREEFWMFVLFYFIILIGSLLLGRILFGFFGMMIYFLVALAHMIPYLGVGVRRMHDTGHSGWFLLVPVYSFILAVSPGEPGTNRWGPDPLNQTPDRQDGTIDSHLIDDDF